MGDEVRGSGPLQRLTDLTGLRSATIRAVLLGLLLVPGGCVATFYLIGESIEPSVERVATADAPDQVGELVLGDVVVEHFTRGDRGCARVVDERAELDRGFRCMAPGDDHPVLRSVYLDVGLGMAGADGIELVASTAGGVRYRGAFDPVSGVFAVPLPTGTEELHFLLSTGERLVCRDDPPVLGFPSRCEPE